MPPEKRLWLNNQECLPPGSHGLCQKHQQNAIPLGAYGSFALSTKDDKLLTQERIFSDKFGFPSGKIRQRPEQQGRVQGSCPMQETILENVKARTYQVFDRDENTRHRMNFSFLKMGGLSEHEGRANFVKCTLISRFSARRGTYQIMLKMPILRTDDPSSQHRH